MTTLHLCTNLTSLSLTQPLIPFITLIPTHKLIHWHTLAYTVQGAGGMSALLASCESKGLNEKADMHCPCCMRVLGLNLPQTKEHHAHCLRQKHIE